jgi:hypothetical protein
VVQWAVACRVVARWSLAWACPWVAWACPAAHQVATRAEVNRPRQVRNRAARWADQRAQAVRPQAVKPAAPAARKVALRLDPHRALAALAARVVHHRQAAQVARAHRVADPAVLRAVAQAGKAGKAAWRRPNRVLQYPCAVVSRPQPGHRHPVLTV